MNQLLNGKWSRFTRFGPVLDFQAHVDEDGSVMSTGSYVAVLAVEALGSDGEVHAVTVVSDPGLLNRHPEYEGATFDGMEEMLESRMRGWNVWELNLSPDGGEVVMG